MADGDVAGVVVVVADGVVVDGDVGSSYTMLSKPDAPTTSLLLPAVTEETVERT